MRWIVITVFVLLYMFVTFFGLGPVLLADGTTEERTVTFIVVLIIYLVLTFLFAFVLKKIKH